MKLKSLNDLLTHELKDLYSAETQLTKALPRMAKEASHPDLVQAFEAHLKETEGHRERLEKIAEMLDIKVTGHTCQAMKGLVEEAKELIGEDAPDDVKDAGLIGQAQRVEHYEIAGYGTARTFAERLGLDKVAKLLEATLQEEKETDVKLTRLATGGINAEAAH